MAELLWGGRFASGPSEALMNLSRSDPRYFRLYREDLAGSRAHARELERARILTAAECQEIVRAIDVLEADVAAGSTTPIPADEDLHTFLERVLRERLGPLGGKLRAGRSRNDQAANDLRLFLRSAARRLATLLLGLQDALVMQAERHAETLAPGFTHLQPAQPIVFGHQLLAHAQAIARDIDRFRDWDRRSARSPLGAAALAGSAIALQPELSARELGYTAPCENSIDAVASRDHVAEFLFVTAMTGVDLSRLAEEICLWVSRQFGWIAIDDAYSTGSSIMPQKKNPDIAELTRGKAGRIIGNLSGLMATLKGLPLAYNRDLIEDKNAALDTIDTLSLVLPAMTGLVASMRVQVDRMREHATQGFTLATEVADWLSRRGVPFNEAHEITGALVQLCEKRGLELWEVTPDDLASVDKRLTRDVLQCLTPEAAVAARAGYGGTAPVRVREQIARLRAVLDEQRGWAAAAPLP
jgi:argininosuccinate lyase